MISNMIMDAAIVASHLDYCNGLLSGTADYYIKKLQRLQNALA